MMEEFKKKGVTKEEIEELISYRDGCVNIGPLELEFLKSLGYRLEYPKPDDESYEVYAFIDGNTMTATEAYCYERYAELKKKVCDKLGVQYYVQLDLDWMLSTYFVHY